MGAGWARAGQGRTVPHLVRVCPAPPASPAPPPAKCAHPDHLQGAAGGAGGGFLGGPQRGASAGRRGPRLLTVAAAGAGAGGGASPALSPTHPRLCPRRHRSHVCDPPLQPSPGAQGPTHPLALKRMFGSSGPVRVKLYRDHAAWWVCPRGLAPGGFDKRDRGAWGGGQLGIGHGVCGGWVGQVRLQMF